MKQFNSSNIFSNYTNVSKDGIQLPPIFFPYLISEIIIGVLAGVGNAMTLYVFTVDRKLRRLTNYYIASLALADFLLGILGIPCAILTFLGLPRTMWSCLLVLSSLLVLCAISIFCLLAVSIDRYWAVLYPLAYANIMTGKLARRIIIVCWLLGTVVGLLPVFGWHKETNLICLFTKVVDYDFLVFFYFAMIIFPGLLMTFSYLQIFLVVSRQEKRYIRSKHGMLQHLASINTQEANKPPESTWYDVLGSVDCPAQSSTEKDEHSSVNISVETSVKPKTTHLSPPEITVTGDSANELKVICNGTPQSSNKNVEHPLLNSQYTKSRGKEIKAAKTLSIIVGFFFICWFPINTINCIQAFCPNCYVPFELLLFTIILSHANSAVNPILYAYNMKDFRRSFKRHIWDWDKLKIGKFRRGRSPVSTPSTTEVSGKCLNTSVSSTRELPSLATPELETVMS